jgi:hypothetical protein
MPARRHVTVVAVTLTNTRRYEFFSYIITDAVSVGAVEPALKRVGGTWSEPLVLPLGESVVCHRRCLALVHCCL